MVQDAKANLFGASPTYQTILEKNGISVSVNNLILLGVSSYWSPVFTGAPSSKWMDSM